MNANLCDILGNEIRDLIRLIKDETIKSANISSFRMHEYNMENNGKRINVYSLIPGLEESIIIEFISNKVGNKSILIKDRFFSEISKETIDALKARNNKIEVCENKSNETELLELLEFIPDEIITLDQIFSLLSIEPDISLINSTFKKYCENIKRIRNTQIEYIKTIHINNIIKRSL